jgi:antitoxin (DNA-binding transcriptional repressor) of toxin-antitoxin stability system
MEISAKEDKFMQTATIRELTHNFSHFISLVKNGEQITILERHNPVAEIIPHNKNLMHPGWKRTIIRKKTEGESFAVSTVKSREEG